MTNDTSTPTYLPPPPDKIRDLLAAELDGTTVDQPIRERALHGAVSAYVRQLKAANVPPERAIVMIKTMANRGGIPNSRHDDSAVSNWRESLMWKLVQWTIAEYYRDD